MTIDTPTVTRRSVLGGLASVAGVSLAGCTSEGLDAPASTETSSDATTTTDSIAPVGENGSTAFDQELLQDRLDDLPTNELTDGEIADMKFMREEEKLARDVYITLGASFDYRVFDNIADSEQTHTDAVLALLDKYDVEDPAVDEVGVFTNEELQSMYDSLLEKGQASAEAALGVGAEIEEIDAIDIQEKVDATDEQAITLVYENLLRGSRNHLRAFVSVLEDQLDVTYEPRHLDESEYEEIINSPMEPGGSGGHQGNGKN